MHCKKKKVYRNVDFPIEVEGVLKSRVSPTKNAFVSPSPRHEWENLDGFYFNILQFFLPNKYMHIYKVEYHNTLALQRLVSFVSSRPASGRQSICHGFSFVVSISLIVRFRTV